MMATIDYDEGHPHVMMEKELKKQKSPQKAILLLNVAQINRFQIAFGDRLIVFPRVATGVGGSSSL
jgi:hypothetical protein